MTTIEDLVSVFKKQDLTGNDIVTLTGKQPILYSDLKKYKSLRQLVGKEGYAIVLYQTSDLTTGHFVMLGIRKDGSATFGDPYGIHWGTEKRLGASYDANMPRYINNLLAPYEAQDLATYNTIDFQSKNPLTSTCGRWSSLFCLLKELSWKTIGHLMQRNANAYVNSDNIAVLLTMLPLGNIQSYLEHED